MKRTILLIGLGIAFLCVSAWVALSRGRNAKAVRAKFRLGGAILTLVSLTSLASCNPDGGDMMTCYDPAPPIVNNIGIDIKSTTLRNGDIVTIYGDCRYDGDVRLVVTSPEGVTLQSEEQSFGQCNDLHLEFVLNVGDYTGKAAIHIYYNTTATDAEDGHSVIAITIEE